MSVWVAGDCNLLLNVKRDNQIKTNWNETVGKNDEVLIIGDYIKNNIYND
jgi:calcineurin-like phosphoesterase family protein